MKTPKPTLLTASFYLSVNLATNLLTLSLEHLFWNSLQIELLLPPLAALDDSNLSINPVNNKLLCFQTKKLFKTNIE